MVFGDGAKWERVECWSRRKKNHAGVGHGTLTYFMSIILRDRTRSSRVDSTHTHTCGNIFAELKDDDVNFLRRHSSEASSCFLFKSSAGGGGGGCTFVLSFMFQV